MEINQSDQVEKHAREVRSLKKELANTLEYLETTLEHVDKMEYQLQWMQSSIFWKMRTIYMRLRGFRLANLRSLSVKGFHVLKSQGAKKAFHIFLLYLRKGRLAITPSPVIDEAEYKRWITQNEVYNLWRVESDLEEFSLKPTISIITPVYNVEREWLNACIQSVVDQSYPYWELCLHDDASTNPETVATLKEWEGKDKRIKISYGEKNEHICGASNRALEMATGEYVSLLDCDDIISPQALYEFVKYINAHPDADFIYSDEDKIDVDDVRSNPFFRPAWSPHLLRSLNYITHMVVIKKSLGDSIGWFRMGFEGAQDYDLFLRLTAKTKSIHHIPKVLYHWRMTPTSTATDTSVKSYVQAHGEQALRDYLDDQGVRYDSVSQGIGISNYRVKYSIPNDTLVSIIIPFKDQVHFLIDCVDSIIKKTTYQNYEILLVDNNSEKNSTAQYLESIDDPRIRIVQYDKPFNFSALNNWAVQHARGNVICFLNNDTKVIEKNWIQEMAGLAIQPEVGAVGAKLLYDDGTIQHAGIILGMTGLTGHVFARQQPETSYYRLTEFTNNFLAVTAACLMIETKKFKEVGGFNEEFTICGNDVNLGLDLHERGYYNVYTPYAELYHYESKTRDKKPPDGDFEISKKRYAPYLGFRDPFFNPNLSLRTEEIHIRMKDEKPLSIDKAIQAL